MNLLNVLGLATDTPNALPAFIREVQDIRGVRVLRLQGPVGMEISRQFRAAEDAAAKTKDAFLRPSSLRAMYPRLDEWLAIKKKYDPKNRFTS